MHSRRARDNYNYFRDYDPSTGRYLESDRLGLFGGSFSTYDYTNNNPIMYVDPFGLCWLFLQSTGTLVHLNADGTFDYVASGYSGIGAGLNNPDMQNVDSIGSLPQGFYTIQPQQNNTTYGPHPHQLPASMRLTPNPGNQMYGRAGFLIHGPHANDHQNSSNGCPIFAKKDRDQIGGSGDNCLQVLP